MCHPGRNSLFATLRAVYNLRSVSSRCYSKAQLATEAAAQTLEPTQPAALLVKRQTTYVQTGMPIETSRAETSTLK
ncbi:MAG: UTRA domain-containing protein [Aggregatilineales bacterium]